jgi:predicted RNA-binding Zn ribbon-like protein
VETAAREGRSRERLSHSRLGFAWSLPFDELEDVGRAFALTAIQLLIARNDRREVRECKGDNCGWLFLDHSKGGHRNLVLGGQLRGCGAKIRSRAYFAAA